MATLARSSVRSPKAGEMILQSRRIKKVPSRLADADKAAGKFVMNGNKVPILKGETHACPHTRCGLRHVCAEPAPGRSPLTRRRRHAAVTEGGVTTELGQSKALERFIAKRHGLMGDNDIEAAKIDMICEHVRDFKDNYQKEKGKGEDATAAWWATGMKEGLEKIEAIVGSKFAVGNKPSLAGITIFSTVVECVPSATVD